MIPRLVIAGSLLLALCGCERRRERELASLRTGLHDVEQQITALHEEVVSRSITNLPSFETQDMREVDEIRKGIHLVTGNSFDVERGALRRMLQPGTTAFRLSHFLPQRDDSTGNFVVGIRLLDVPQGSVLSALGFLRGDVVEQINGIDLTNHEDALRAYVSVRDATTTVSVHLRRGSEQIVRDYEIE